MRRLRQLPLRVRLVLVMTSLVTVALALTGLAASTAMQHYLMNRVDGQLRVAAAQISAQAAYDGPDGPDFEHETSDPDDAPADSCATQPNSTNAENANSRPLLPSEYFVQIGDSRGTPTGQASNFLVHCNAAPAIPAMTVTEVNTRAGAPFSVPARVGAGHWRVVMSALPGGTQTVAVAIPLSDVENTLHTLSLVELTIGAAVLIVLAGMGYLAVRRSLRPLVDVENTAEAIAEGDLTQRVAVSDPRTEVGRLSLALNKMLGQIESAFRARELSEQQARTSEARMRRFVTDAGHELRTPLTSVRGFAELYRLGGAKQSIDVDQMMHRIEAESARMSVLVDDLLLLARLDQQRPLANDVVDLEKVVHDAVVDAHAVAPSRSIELQVDDAARSAPVIGDEARLRQMIANLTSNALQHTPGNAAVVVRLRVERKADAIAVIEVSDTGPGITAADAERVFERFYRVETSRSRANGGSGLGLSIVAALVEAHGGAVELETAEGIGSTFRVRLPMDEHISGQENPADLDG